jgi:hypothetical protein
MATLAFGACNSTSVTPPTDASTGVVCGTYDNPGILKVTGRSPAIGATVLNQGIVHGFVVENAPAVFTTFTLKYGATHTAGVSEPSDPKFQATVSGSNLIYQLTIDRWSHAPGHVELVTSDGYQTRAGCYWAFPSPLFSYDITPGLDGGAAEAKGSVDGGVSSVDGPGALDTASALDTQAEIDVPIAIDGPATAEPDGGAPIQLDSTLDIALSLDASLD